MVAPGAGLIPIENDSERKSGCFAVATTAYDGVDLV